MAEHSALDLASDLNKSDDVIKTEVIQRIDTFHNLRKLNDTSVTRLNFLNQQLKKIEAKQITNFLRQETKHDR